MRNILAWLLGWEVVWLQLHDGEVIKRLARPTPFGLFAWRFRLSRIGPALCVEGGKVKGACYIMRWSPIELANPSAEQKAAAQPINQ